MPAISPVVQLPTVPWMTVEGAVAIVAGLVAGSVALKQRLALLIAGLAVKEGIEAWRGEGCCVAS